MFTYLHLERILQATARVSAVLLSMLVFLETEASFAQRPSSLQCQEYARKAIEEATEARRLNCGFSGPRWDASYSEHYNACVATGNFGWYNQETNARAQELAACRQRATLYRSRWDQVGGPWTTGWVYNHREPVCGAYAPGCNCGPGRNFCGVYRDGEVTTWWPQGCGGSPMTIRCTSERQTNAPVDNGQTDEPVNGGGGYNPYGI